MAMSAASMKAKIMAAYTARTGLTMVDNPQWGVLIDLCTGIINEITANAKVSVGITVTSTGTDAISGNAVNTTGATTTQGSIL